MQRCGNNMLDLRFKMEKQIVTNLHHIPKDNLNMILIDNWLDNSSILKDCE